MSKVSANGIEKNNLKGSLWMIAAMAAFAIEDAFIKAATDTLSIAQVLIFFGLGGMFVFSCILIFNRRPLFIPDIMSPSMLIRFGFEVTGRLFYVLSIALIPLSVATVILQATPLVVILGAVLIFGETVGWRRWVAILVGLLGVLVIVQPGTDGFSSLSLLAIIAMIGFAGRDLASRAAPVSVGTAHLGLYGFLAIVIAGVLYFAIVGGSFVIPDTLSSLALLGGILFGVCAYSCLMAAMRTGEVSAVTPFRYTRLLFGVLLGLVIFGEELTSSMILGSVLIVLSGLFILSRRAPNKTID